ncbi:MAG: M42 family metallopeptidase [Chloroflexi bacterium]|nr:M42 family metallopeptidase [Chloroflexota bacterium]
MNDEQLAFLRSLVESTGPSGYEERTQAIWRARVQDAAADISTDSLGNCIATLNPAGRPRVMLDAHIDEIGFLIRYIDDNGYLYFATIGGFDPSTLAGDRVRILGKQGDVIGVFGRKPTHLLESDERKKAPELKQMWIDIGATNREEAEALVDIGDAAGRAAGLERLQGNLVTSPALADRVGSYIIAEAIRALAASPPAAAVFAASSVQEEIGLRGARVSSYETEADIGIAVEVTYTSDHPHVSKTEIGDVKVGAGPVLSRGANTNPRIFRRLVEAANAEGIPFQVEAFAGGTPTDQNVMQLSRRGMATGLISVPCRYLHTASEVVSLDDIDASVALLSRFVRDLQGEVDLAP